MANALHRAAEFMQAAQQRAQARVAGTNALPTITRAEERQYNRMVDGWLSRQPTPRTRRKKSRRK